jgi:hypothetical protein
MAIAILQVKIPDDYTDRDIANALDSAVYTFQRTHDMEGHTISTPAYNVPYLIEIE